MNMKKLVEKVLCKISGNYREKLIRKQLHNIGSNCLISTFSLDQPRLISLGNNVTLAAGAVLLNHDYSVQVLRNLHPDTKLDKVGPIIIGNNVFVGAGTIVLPNCVIEDNTIIAAGSVLTGKRYQSGFVWGGIPAKPIMSIEDYYCRVKDESEKLPWIEYLGKKSVDELNAVREQYYFKK